MTACPKAVEQRALFGSFTGPVRPPAECTTSSTEVAENESDDECDRSRSPDLLSILKPEDAEAAKETSNEQHVRQLTDDISNDERRIRRGASYAEQSGDRNDEGYCASDRKARRLQAHELAHLGLIVGGIGETQGDDVEEVE